MIRELLDTSFEILRRLKDNVSSVIRGQDAAITRLLAAFAAGGHVLLEDFPGTGKTTLAKALALSTGTRFTRIQFTPDLLPTDILGVSVFDRRQESFVFHPGPIFTNILLADEINRSSPRTQSALLEAMAEGQVTVDGHRRELEQLFFVVATQNPIEFAGTYPLPEAQMDRFSVQFALGYVSLEEETAILADQEKTHPIERIGACVGIDDVLHLRSSVSEVRLSDELRRYLVELVRATREAPGVKLGASPRASLALMKLSQAMALMDGKDFVVPDHIQSIASSVLAHRIMLDAEARFAGVTAEQVIDEVLRSVPVPR